jgi:hypothetical protein
MMISPRVQGAILKSGLQFAGRLGKILHQLWHEVTGTLFLVLGLSLIPSTIRLWRMPDVRSRAVAATMFIVLMLYFGSTSFLRAKRVHKGKR